MSQGSLALAQNGLIRYETALRDFALANLVAYLWRWAPDVGRDGWDLLVSRSARDHNADRLLDRMDALL